MGHLIHYQNRGVAFCADPNATVLDPEVARVTCPLCRQMLAGHILLHGAVDYFGAALRQRLGALQADPRVQTLRDYAGVLLKMEREVEAARSGGTQGGGPPSR